MASAQVEIVRLDASGRLAHQRRARFDESGPECLDDRAGQLVLDHEDAPELAVVRLRPQMVAVRRIHELGSNSHGAAFPPDTALNDGGHGELLADGPDVHVPSLEGEGRGARDDVKTFHVG